MTVTISVCSWVSLQATPASLPPPHPGSHLASVCLGARCPPPHMGPLTSGQGRKARYAWDMQQQQATEHEAGATECPHGSGSAGGIGTVVGTSGGQVLSSSLPAQTAPH